VSSIGGSVPRAIVGVAIAEWYFDPPNLLSGGLVQDHMLHDAPQPRPESRGALPLELRALDRPPGPERGVLVNVILLDLAAESFSKPRADEAQEIVLVMQDDLVGGCAAPVVRLPDQTFDLPIAPHALDPTPSTKLWFAGSVAMKDRACFWPAHNANSPKSHALLGAL
jgi:hypothetical protein